MPTSPYLNRLEAAEYCRMSHYLFKQFVQEWRIPATPIGKGRKCPRLLYHTDDLDAGMRRAALAQAGTTDIEERARAAARSI